MLDAIFKPFVEQSPICVMAVAAIRRLLGNDRLDRLFGRARVGQYVRALMFSDLFDLMAAVVSGSRKSVHHAYQGSGLSVSVVAVYDKLKGIEPSVCQALVRETAAEVATLMAEMDATAGHAGRRAPVLAGYHTKVLDGNCVAATEHRIEPLRRTSAGPAAGQEPGRARRRPAGDRRPVHLPRRPRPGAGRSCRRSTRRSPPATCGWPTGTSARPSSWPSCRRAGRAS